MSNVKTTEVMLIESILNPSPLLRKADIASDDIRELALSLEQGGIENMFTVYPDGMGSYFHGDGNRRFTACQLLAIEDRAVKGYEVGEVPVVVADYTPDSKEILLIQIRGNVNSKATVNKDYADAILNLAQNHGMNQKEIAVELGVSTALISKWNSTLSLPEEVREEIENGDISLVNATQMAKYNSRLQDDEDYLEKARTLKGEDFKAHCEKRAQEIREENSAPSTSDAPKIRLKTSVEIADMLAIAEDDYLNEANAYNEGKVQALKEVLSIDEATLKAKEDAITEAKAKAEAKRAGKSKGKLLLEIAEKELALAKLDGEPETIADAQAKVDALTE